MTATQEESSSDYLGFDDFFIDAARYMDFRGIGSEADGAAIGFSPEYSARKVIEGYERRWGVTRWTPELLARAMVEFKERVGGEAEATSVESGALEITQSWCEFGEPRGNSYQGNMCSVCRGVLAAIARDSGLGRADCVPEPLSTIAKGSPMCEFTVELM